MIELKKNIQTLDKVTAIIFKIKPLDAIKEMLNSLVEKTIALGGVAMGIIKAQLAASVIGRDN